MDWMPFPYFTETVSLFIDRRPSYRSVAIVIPYLAEIHAACAFHGGRPRRRPRPSTSHPPTLHPSNYRNHLPAPSRLPLSLRLNNIDYSTRQHVSITCPACLPRSPLSPSSRQSDRGGDHQKVHLLPIDRWPVCVCASVYARAILHLYHGDRNDPYCDPCQ